MVIFIMRDVIGNEVVIFVEFKDFLRFVLKGDVIYFSDGFIVLRVEDVRD